MVRSFFWLIIGGLSATSFPPEPSSQPLCISVLNPLPPEAHSAKPNHSVWHSRTGSQRPSISRHWAHSRTDSCLLQDFLYSAEQCLPNVAVELTPEAQLRRIVHHRQAVPLARRHAGSGRSQAATAGRQGQAPRRPRNLLDHLHLCRLMLVTRRDLHAVDPGAAVWCMALGQAQLRTPAQVQALTLERRARPWPPGLPAGPVGTTPTVPKTAPPKASAHRPSGPPVPSPAATPTTPFATPPSTPLGTTATAFMPPGALPAPCQGWTITLTIQPTYG